MKYNDLINDLLNILDQNEDILKIKKLKKEILNDSNFLNDLENYRLIKSVESKKKLYENKKYVSYLESETNINILIKAIKDKFNFIKRGCIK